MKHESALSLDELEQLEALCLLHENAPTAADRDLEHLLLNVTGVTRGYFLRELLWQDIEIRQRSGESITAADYSFTEPDDLEIIEAVLSELESHPSDNTNSNLPDRYQKTEEIGFGGIGSVWRVFDHRAQRPLAVKTLRKKFRHERQANIRLEREAILTGALQHPGVPPVHDHGHLSDGSVFFAMKLIEGKTLAEILEDSSNDDSDLQKNIRIFEKVAQTMAYVHSQQVIHRDIKPENVMVGTFAEVQVMDWGMAKQLDAAKDQWERLPLIPNPEIPNDNPKTDAMANDTLDHSMASSIDDRSLTRMGDILGTPRYMAPEQARGELSLVGAHSDVFSMGSILFEILTGKRLYGELKSSEILAHAAAGKLDRSLALLNKTTADANLLSLCRRCLSPDAADRPEDAAVIAREIGEHFANVQQRAKDVEIELRATEVRSREEAKRRKTFSRMLLLVAGVFAFGLAGVIWQWNIAKLNAADYKTAAALAERNALEFKTAEALAKRRLKESRAIVDDYFTEIAAPNGDLEKLPGASDLRRKLLTKAKNYYSQFVSETEDAESKDTRLEFALANHRLGVIIHKLDPGSQLAIDAFDTEIKELRSLIEEDGDDFSEPHWRYLGDGLSELSRIFWATGRNKEFLAALQELVEARITLHEKIDSDETLLQLGMAYSNLGLGHEMMGNRKDWLAAMFKALEIGEMLLINNPDATKFLVNVSKFKTNVGGYFGWQTGEWEKAREHLESALELVSRDLDYGELETQRLESQRLIHQNLAMVYYHCKNIPASKNSFEANLKYARDLVTENPLFPDYEYKLAVGWANYSTFLFKIGEIEEAIEAQEKSKLIVEKLAADHPLEFNFIKFATQAQKQYCDFLPLTEDNTIEYLQRETLLRQYMEQFPKAVNPQQELALLLGSTSNEANEELLDLTSWVEKQKKSSISAKCARSLALIRNDKNDEAIELLESIGKSRQDSATWQVLRSLSLVEANEFEAARACLEEAEKLVATIKPTQYPHPYYGYLLQQEIRRRLNN